MSSGIRNMQRKVLRASPDYEPAPQPMIELPDGGYMTLRPTKGWITISGARLWAQGVIAELRSRKLPTRPKKAPKLYRKPAAVPPAVDTRQRRRALARRTAAWV